MSCSSEQNVQHQSSDYLILPFPQSMAPGYGYFPLNEEVTLSFDEADPELQSISSYFQEWLSAKSLPELKVEHNTSGRNAIQLKISPDIGVDTYALTITTKGILIQGGSPASVFYGIQSLSQLIQQQQGQETLEIPCVHIEDQPAFSYRGLHLDVGRHFFPVSFIKKYIDLLARYKMNRFHWHLTEDQGWRIEIKKYPKLQEVAAYRNETLIGHYNDNPQRYDGEPYGGFYTQEEIKEVVAYAKERYVMVIPEIEMPGHAQAALAAYPELSCAGGDIQTATKWGVFEEVYCPTEATFEFLENVLLEVIELFPSPYIHIGGDECPKTRWKESAFCQALIKEKGLKDEHGLQSYFIQRIEQFLNKNDRQIIGWDEILEGGLAPNATVMSWRGEEGGIEAAKQGHDVIMSPTSHCYLDYYQSQHSEEPLAIGGFLPLDKVYNYHPIPEELSVEEAKYIQGVQGNLWTEYISTPDKATYMTFPRAIALAEVGWTKEPNKDLNRFLKSVSKHLEWLEEEGINVANHLFDLEPLTELDENGDLSLRFTSLAKVQSIRYTSDGTPPTMEAPALSGSIALEKSGTYTGQAFQGDQAVGRSAQLDFNQHLGTGASIQLTNAPSERYSAGGAGAILNGIQGSSERYGDKEWLGFEGDDFVATVDLGESKTIDHINFRFFNGPGQWIYPPRNIEVQITKSLKEEGATFRTSVQSGDDKIVETKLETKGTSGRYLQIKIPNYGLIPEGSQGGGNRAWLFIDEITLN